MLQTVQGLVLRSVKYAETGLIFDVYTREYGLRGYILHGVRTAKARFAPGLLQPLSWVEMVVQHREQQDLNRVQDLRPAYVYQRLPYEPRRTAVGMFMLELAQQGLKQAEAQTSLYEFLSRCFQCLDQAPSGYQNIHLWFMVHFAAHLGFAPRKGELSDWNPDYCFDLKEGEFMLSGRSGAFAFSPENSLVLHSLLDLPLEAALELRLHDSLGRYWRRQFIEDMLRFYHYHLDGFKGLQAYKIWMEVLE